MSRVTVAAIRESLLGIADGVLLDAPTVEHHNAAKKMQISVSACTSFRTVGAVGLRYAVTFEELGDYETANYINATIEAAF